MGGGRGELMRCRYTGSDTLDEPVSVTIVSCARAQECGRS